MPRSQRKPRRKNCAPAAPARGVPRGRLLGLAAVLAIAGIALWTLRPKTGAVDVKVPELSAQGMRGAAAFAADCAACHGESAGGSERGPPLIHTYYVAGHHGDGAFRLAVRQGVRQHHWRFGDMPAQPRVSDEEIAAIIRYVRELQQANGIGGGSH